MPCFVEHWGRSHHQRWQVLERENVVMRMTRERILASWLPWQWVWLASNSSSLLSVWRKDDWCSNIVLAPSSELRFWSMNTLVRPQRDILQCEWSVLPSAVFVWDSSMQLASLVEYEHANARSCDVWVQFPPLSDESFLCFRGVPFRWEHDCN
jgi:hypothetical protein